MEMPILEQGALPLDLLDFNHVTRPGGLRLGHRSLHRCRVAGAGDAIRQKEDPNDRRPAEVLDVLARTDRCRTTRWCRWHST